MLSISTNGIGQMDLSATSKPKSKQKDEQVNDAFAALMNMSSVSKDLTHNEIKSDDQVEELSSVDNIDDSVEVYNKYNENEDGVKVVSEEPEQVNNEKIINPTSDIDVMDKDLVEILSRLIDDIKQILFDKLGISEGKMDAIVSELDMTSLDFLDENFVKTFILNNENSTEVDILINEDLSNLIDNVTLDVENAIINYDAVSLSELTRQDSGYREQILRLLEEFNAGQETVNLDGDIVLEALDDKGFKMPQNDMSLKTEITDDTMEFHKEVSITTNIEPDTEDFNNQDYTNNNYEPVVFEKAYTIENQTLDGVSRFSEYEDVQQMDIIRQVIDSVKVNVSKEVTSLEVQLNPENLGKVQITVASKNGVMQAQILAENELAKNAIENNIAMLKETFNNQELKVDAIEVMVSTYGFLDHEQGDGGEQKEDNHLEKFKSINLVDDINIEELNEDEQLTVEMMKAKGNSLNYLV